MVRVRVRLRLGLGLGLGLGLLISIYSNQTIHCQQILGGLLGVKVMHYRADAPRSNPFRAILNFFSPTN